MSVRGAETLAQHAAPVAGSPSGSSPSRWLTIGVPLALAIVAVAVPVWIAAHYGALDIPRSDDWSYLLTEFRWLDGGGLGFNHWAAPPLIGQLLVGAPVALATNRSIGAMHVLSAIGGWIGLVAVFAMGRRVASTGMAAAVAVTVAVSPIMLPLAATFMTDHWAFAAEMVSLALAYRAFTSARYSSGVWIASVVVAFFAVSIRQYALVPAFAVLIVGFVEAHRAGDARRTRTVLLTAGVFVFASLLLGLWWIGRPGVSDLTPNTPSAKTVAAALRGVLGYLRLTGLLLLPVIILLHPVRIVRRAFAANPGLTIVLGGGLAAVFLFQLSAPLLAPFVGNYVARAGVLSQDVLTGTRPDVVAPWIWGTMLCLASAAAVVLVLSVVPAALEMPERFRQGTWWPTSPVNALVAVNIVGFAAFVMLEAVFGLPLFDRYVLPVLPLVAFAALRASQPVSGRAVPVAAGCALMLLGAIGLAFTAESASFDGTRWKVAQLATRAGFTPLQVDGGFEWDAWHQGVGPPYWPMLEPKSRKRDLKREFDRPFCVRVQVGRIDPTAQIVAAADSHAPTRGPARIAATRIPGRCAS